MAVMAVTCWVDFEQQDELKKPTEAKNTSGQLA